MDSWLSSGAVARALDVSIPRVHRAARSGLVPYRRGPNGRLRFPPAVLPKLRRRWGWCPRIKGLDREEAFALAALSRRPLGLRSARAVARAAGISPTTAARALRRLERLRYVRQRTVRVAEGRVREARVWTVRWGSPAWCRAASDIGRCVLPAVPTLPRATRVPRRLGHLFWNVEVAALDPRRDARYIADRLLRESDPQGLAWLATAVPTGAIASASRGRGLDRRAAALGRALAATGS